MHRGIHKIGDHMFGGGHETIVSCAYGDVKKVESFKVRCLYAIPLL